MDGLYTTRIVSRNMNLTPKLRGQYDLRTVNSKETEVLLQ